jgi:hypothetical protein
MSKSKLVLQINNLEVEIEIRNSAAANFAQKHLKKLIDESYVNSFIHSQLNEIKSVFTKEISNIVANPGAYSNSWKLKDEVKTQIEVVIREKISRIIGEKIDEQIKELDLDKMIRGYLNHDLRVKIRQEILDEISKIK